MIRLFSIALGVFRILLAMAMAIIGLPLAVLILILSCGVPNLTAYLGQRGVFLWSWLTRRLLGIRVRVMGTPPPRGSFAICNHVSHFDILVLTGYYPTSLLAKKEILRWPLIGQLAWMIGTVFVDRSDREKTAGVAAMMQNYLQAGVTVTLFPEGTCGDGKAILPFKRSLFSVPADLKIPTYPVAIRYPNDAAAWTDDTPFALHMFRLLCQPRQDAVIAFGEAIPPGQERKELAFAAQDKVEELFAKIPS
jgi:1-acyl-sn-glycerol-3-phosphate acyltransferase